MTLPFRDREFEKQIIDAVLIHRDSIVDLDENQRAYLKALPIKAVCPVCKKNTFEIYDAHNQRVRRTCSVECSNLDKSDKKWECVICRSRFKNHTGLQKHLRSEHPDIDDHEYIRRYWLDRGWNTANLKRFCSHCSRALKLDFAHARYRPCPCVNAEKKIAEISKELAGETDEKIRDKYERQIRGHKSFQKQVRPAATIAKSGGLKSVAHPGQTKKSDQFECTWIEGLNEHAELFRRLLEQNKSVYEAFYRLWDVSKAHSEIPVHEAVVEADAALKRELSDHGWSVFDGNIAGTALYVWALNFAGGRGATPEWQMFILNTTYSVGAYMRLQSSLKYDDKKLPAFLIACSFQFPVVAVRQYQCWQRLALMDEGKPVTRLNPVAFLALHNDTHHS